MLQIAVLGFIVIKSSKETFRIMVYYHGKMLMRSTILYFGIHYKLIELSSNILYYSIYVNMIHFVER